MLTEPPESLATVDETKPVSSDSSSLRKLSPEKKSAAVRVQQLLGELKQRKKRIADLERELGEIRSEQEARQKAMPAQIVAAREKGRRLFGDFDEVTGLVALDLQAFEALLSSSNGPELMYYCGLGMKALATLRQFQNQAKTAAERVEYYRNIHRQHFAGTGVENGR
jgi:hypothetical protein